MLLPFTPSRTAALTASATRTPSGETRPPAVSLEGLSFAHLRNKVRYLTSHPGFQQSKVRTLSRLCHWGLHCALNIPAIVALPEWNARFYLPPRWHGGGTTMIYALRERYEAELLHLNRFVSSGMIVVDGGANCGIYTIVAAKLVGPSGVIFSFEPGREAFSTLQANVQLNGLVNVRPCRAALSDQPGIAVLYHHREGPNSFSLGPPDEEGPSFEEVMLCSLDYVMPEELVPRVGLVKLDVEGAEELVLRGARSILARSHPTVIFEMHHRAARRLCQDPVGSWRLLSSMGYRFFVLDDSGSMCPLKSPPDSTTPINLIAMHREGGP
jgi:FkbM family methyltransferase